MEIKHPSETQSKALIQPAVGWVISAFVIFYGLYQWGEKLGDLKTLFWGLGFLISASIYAINELHVMRNQATRQHADLKAALNDAHENAVERDMAQDALHESQTRYYHLAEATFEAICIHDRGTILDLNQNFATLFGYSLEELNGKNIEMFCAPEMRDEMHRMVLDNATENYEITGLDRHGRRFPMAVNVKKIPYNGREVRVVAIRDLSHQRAQEAEHEEARKKVLFSEGSRRAILESSVDGILIFGQDDMIQDANPAAEQAFGFSRDEIIGRRIVETVIAPSHRANYQKMLEEATAGGQGFLGRRVKVKAMRRDGSEFDSEVTTTAIKNHNDMDFVATVRDISERMEQQRRVESLLARMRALVENLQAGVVVLDEEQHVVTANQSFCDMFGFVQGPDSVLKRSCGDLSPQFKKLLVDGKHFCERAGEAMQSRTALPPEEFVTTDGRTLERQYVPAFMNGAFQGHLWIYRDTSRSKRAETEMKSARDAALDSARFKSQFLANMSHEIRTPMNAIVGMTDLLLDTPLDEEQKDFASTVRQASESLLTLINQILDFSKIEAGKLSLEHEDFDLRELVEGVAGMFAARSQAKGIELVVDIAPGLPTLLRGDSGRLGQVLINLMGNALKFTEAGDIVMKVAALGEGPDSVKLKFEVKDSGMGIAPEALAHLFQPFVQADGSITRRFGGTGLGLAISKDLIELMGGEIGVESSVKDPRGTCFWATLSLERQTLLNHKHESTQAGPLKEMRALIVDDNATNRQIVAHQLKGWDMAHETAHSASEGVRLLKAAAAGGAPFDVLLLDLQMPDKDGLSLAAEILQEPGIPTPRMILMSSLGHSLSRETLAASGVLACLNKPVKQASLFRALQGMSAPESPFAGAEKGMASATIARSARVLIAEDNLVNQRVIRSQMAKLGVQFDLVSNGHEALAALESGRYGLVLMDCQMPVMDGLAATALQRRGEKSAGRGQHVPIVAMTANALEGDEKRCLEAGMDGYLSKPLKLEDLEKALNRWIPENQALRAAHEALPVFSDAELRKGVGDACREDGVFAELVEIFSTDTPVRLARLERAAREKDCVGIRAEAHAIKGSCLALGALRMGGSLEILEAMGRESRCEGAEAMVKAVKVEFQFTLEELAKAAGLTAAVA